MTALRLSKVEATGNDFLVVGPGVAPASVTAPVAVALCDRHRGVGADGVIVIGSGSAGADCAMILRNADGARAELSGNGMRCLALVAARAGLGRDDVLVVDTDAGRREVRLERDGGEVVWAEVDMGAATFEPERIPVVAPSATDLEATVHGVVYRGDAVGVGNPHFVVLVDDPESARVTGHGPRLERDERFPARTNVEFVTVRDRATISMRVWERGVGETLSCGTGACAAVAVVGRRGLVDDRVQVTVPGGDLVVTRGDTLRLGGGVRHVFDVEVDVSRLVGGESGG